MPQTEAQGAGSRGISESRTSRIHLRWWTELPLILLVYGAYSAGRLLARGDVETAVGHGLDILRVEKALNLNLEHPLNRLFTAHTSIGVPADFWYASLHYLVTPLVLIWLFRSRAVHYAAARTWLMVSTLIGLIGFTLMPTCPPRLLDKSHGFVDTMAQYSDWGWWGGQASAPRGLGGMTNQYAAMPSLHVGWSLWCGVVLWRYGRTPLVKALAIVYPLFTTIVVMGTANHYFLDAVAGAAVMGLGLLLVRPVQRGAARLKARLRPIVATALAGRGAGRATAPADATATSSATESSIVSAGCQTSAGERIPHQRKLGTDPGGKSAAKPGGKPRGNKGARPAGHAADTGDSAQTSARGAART
ncbi:phosphatase PAP2 family protein [Streptomyces flavofungini]|uniref:Phosphatase PAP2 family protein n=1 Tax=Streptomyces flavofungini TaxID=68200 RepID=A0ABS0XCY9_9ACTN|nr:phosphatase PAP2 family protein [Streptomyces flavofungini]MBJ3811083.1 phosphatase PAP2 family protein [Streptomyces flavofungini]GHC43749.1 inositol phosphorylceramide synthase [Streptomyces flavofungini]